MKEEANKIPEDMRIIKVTYMDDKEVNIAVKPLDVTPFMDAIAKGAAFHDKRTGVTVLLPKLAMQNVRFISDSKYIPPEKQEVAKEENKQKDVA